jgi:hypothetical protein
MLQSSYVYNEYDFRNRNVSVASLKNIEIPYILLPIQAVFEKVTMYTKTKDYIQSHFFENVLDWMVEEIVYQKLFEYQNVNLIGKAMMLENVHAKNAEEMEEFISNVYHHIIRENGGLMAELMAAKGVIGSLDEK